MSDSSRTKAILALLVTATVLSTGVVGVAFADSPSTSDVQPANEPTDSPDGDAVIENFTQRIETLETVEFTRTTETELNGNTTTTSQRVVADLADNQMRTETLESPTGANTTTVVNETHGVTYNADENTVTEYEITSENTHLLPQLTQLTNESAVEYEYAGTDTVAGEEVYLLDATPKQTQTGNIGNASLTVAVDAETYFPVRIETDVQSERYNVSATQTYENVTINEEIPESAFELDVPEDATQPSFGGPDITSYDEYSALQSSATLSVPPAELADGYEFESARTIDGDGYYTVSMTYMDGEESVHVGVQGESPFDWSANEDYEAVSVGDETGYYAEYDEYGFLRVETDDTSYSVHGTLDEGQAVDIAASILDG
jgi:outer membrane lipoprotein-sorting protein